MPIECEMLRGAPYAKEHCPKCGQIAYNETPARPAGENCAPLTGSEADEDYCIHCGGGPFRLDQLLTISPETDPYSQLPEGEDWEPVRACRPCYRKHYGEPPNGALSGGGQHLCAANGGSEPFSPARENVKDKP